MTQPSSSSPIPWSPTHARLHRCLQQRSLLPPRPPCSLPFPAVKIQ
ncbi:MAG: hypothetical protein LVS60_04300 [Nodosilinea sp. LVE1205-7]